MAFRNLNPPQAYPLRRAAPQRFPLQLPRSSACVLAKTCHEALIFRASVAGES